MEEHRKIINYVKSVNFRRLIIYSFLILLNLQLKPQLNHLAALINMTVLTLFLIYISKIHSFQNDISKFYGVDKVMEISLLALSLLIQCYSFIKETLIDIELV